MEVNKILEDPLNYANKISVDKLVETLKELSESYYNTNVSLVPDDIYDILRSVLIKRDPDNKFLKQVGAPIGTKNKVKLPYPMFSLDKIKPSTDALDTWKKQFKGPYVLSDKLDGVSAMLYKNKGEIKMFTRGDGTYGQDITHLLNYFVTKEQKSKLPTTVAIRGELIITKSNFKKVADQFKNARNAVAGLVNAKHYSTELAKLTDFVAYAVLGGDTQENQMKDLEKWKLNVVTYIVKKDITNDQLSKYLVERRTSNAYEIDGIVVVDSSKVYKLESGNPDYAFAFKAVLTDQIVEATIVDIIWQASKYGYLKPRIQITPVDVSGVTIEYATAFNAKYVQDNKLGPGAVIKLVRSGDVIPYIMEVIKPAANGKAKMPTIPFKWTDTNVDIIVQDVHGEAKSIITIKQLAHFFSVMDVKYISEGLVKKLVDNGYDTVIKIIDADPKALVKIEGLGLKTVTKILDGIKESLANSTMAQLMHASGKFGRGLGIKNFNLILKEYPNIVTDNTDKKTMKDKILELQGFEETRTNQFVDNFDDFKKFFEGLALVVDLSHLKKTVKKDTKKAGKLQDMKIVFTGFRDPELEKDVITEGGSVSGSVSKNTDIVVYKGTDSSKYQKAKELNITLMTPEEFKEKYFNI
jgi:DNA ligase (NAD+)